MTVSNYDKLARKERPKNSHTASKRSGNVRSFSAWGHRCYLLKSFAGDWKATNVFPALAPDLPASFMWKARNDREGLKRYIDALLTERRSESIYFEKAGLVEDIQMFHLDRPDDQNVRVNVGRFIDFMTLRDEFKVPLWGKVHFITDGQNVVPIEFLAALGQLLDPAEKKFYDLTKDWWHCKENDLQKMGLKPEDIHSGMYQKRHAPVMTEMDDQGPVYDEEPAAEDASNYGDEPEELGDTPQAAVTARETEVERILEAKYADIVTLVQPDRGRRYFARRIMNYDGRMLWVGTSFTRTNWKVWQRDTARLLALGLDP